MPNIGEETDWVVMKSQTENRESMRNLFHDPPAEFRPLPFWGINDTLTETELRRQIREMKAKGWGGFFPHPRYGMVTPYLTQQYLEAISICVDEARSNNLEVWIYDEHPFPAGCAGGLVGAARQEYRQQALVMLRHHRLTPIEEGIAYYALKLDKGQLVDLERVRQPESYGGRAENFLHFYAWTAPVQPSTHIARTDDYLHGFPYTDVLSREAVQRFIELTYEAYKSAIGEEFGKTVKGAFSDIPVYQWHYSSPRPSVPWTSAMPRLFQERFGYDLVENLPALFYDVGEYSRVRQNFWQLVNALFLTNYTQQLAEWCARNNLKYTAHYWGEETLHWQIPWTGDVMTHFAHQHIVSIDHILRNIEDPLGVKQAASVAEQLGKPRLISETYALSGHNLTYEERKWIGDWEYALGVNSLVPYIPAYSMRGRRKRDEPPSEFFQQPYWPYEKLINDYFGRLSFLLTRGKRVVDVLLLQPLNSARVLYKPGRELPAAFRPASDHFEGAGASLYRYSHGFTLLCETLLRLHRDFHLGNEELLAQYAQIDNNKFRVGEMSYSVVIVPPSLNWTEKTISLLNDFAANGGKVIIIKPLPQLVDGAERSHDLSAAITVLNKSEEVEGQLESILAPALEIEGGEELLYQHRVLDDLDLFFIANTSLSNSYLNTRITIKGQGSLELWDALSDRQYSLPSQKVGEDLVVTLDFHPVTSFLVLRRREGPSNLPAYVAQPRNLSSVLKLDDAWEFERKDPNALTLDYCEVDIEDAGPFKTMPVWQTHRLLRQAGVGRGFTARFRFDIIDKPASLFLAVEDPRRYRVTLNGELLPEQDNGGWWDSSIRLFKVNSMVRQGENIVELTGTVGIDSEFESIYILGAFALSRNGGFSVVREPERVEGTNLVREGYPFFSGSCVLKQSLEIPGTTKSLYLKLDEVNAIVAQVRVNGVVVDTLLWKPYLVDITRHVQPGRNTLEVELCTSLHNLLGPHHDKRGEARHFVLEHSWTDVANWTDEYFFVPVGVKGVELFQAEAQL